ncbi:MOSC domain-containing protein [Erwinia sp. CPCC 100877]|nr:MOSC domain-containing protein [Erwinia sp. CPCC 100877]
MLTLSRLAIHPVKSMRGLQLSHTYAGPGGPAFDRIFMLTEPDGTFITARQLPQLVLFTPTLLPDGLWLSGPDGSQRQVRFDDFLTHPSPTEVWGNHFTALVAPTPVNHWLSQYLQREVQLRWIGPQPDRRVTRHPEVPLAFADGYPYLLTSESSLDDLRRRCPADVGMNQFRPNLVVRGAAPWQEDSWRLLRIGGIRFQVTKPCSRCIFTTVSPARGVRHPNGEPLSTLKRFRTADNGDVDFGLNLIALNSGIIRVGDEVEVLENGPARRYGAGDTSGTDGAPSAAPAEVTLEWKGRILRGNNQQPLLDQLENQGIRVPWSCRAGVCGSCRIRLLEGEVKPLNGKAVADDGTILCCSCIPQSSLRLSDG